jgi:hypothetical protein
MMTSTTLCEPEPYAVIATLGGPEDIVGLALSDNHTRLFVREVGLGSDGSVEKPRIGYTDIRPDTPPDRTMLAWQPLEEFKPLGMSLVAGPTPGQGTLYVLDTIEPVRIWCLAIDAGEIRHANIWFTDASRALTSANDIQAVGDSAYVTRYDWFGLVPGRSGSWRGLVHIRPDAEPIAYGHGLTGANGIVDLAPERDLLLVSNYWERRLHFVPKTAHGSDVRQFATKKLPIHPDNLTRHGSRILIAGQRNWFLAALNLAAPFMPSPSAVYAIDIAALGPEAEPKLVWDGGWRHGRSVSVAVPIQGGLALGQIRSPGVLLVRCR